MSTSRRQSKPSVFKIDVFLFTRQVDVKKASGEIWANTGHPVSPDKLAFAMGAPGNTFSDQGMRWDNSGKNGHYAAIRWSNQA
jgi:hypothetical protein